MIPFMVLPVYVLVDSDEDTEEYEERIAMIPYQNILFIREGAKRGTTEIVMQDLAVIVTPEIHLHVFESYSKWLKENQNNYITLSRNN